MREIARIITGTAIQNGNSAAVPLFVTIELLYNIKSVDVREVERERRTILESKYRNLLVYGAISCFVTIIDVIVSRFSERFAPVVVANTIGVVVGFCIQYLLASRHVYRKTGGKSFLIFFITFLLNLCMANGIVYYAREIAFGGATDSAAFLISKCCSIVIPFFITYFIRKKFMPTGESVNE